MSQEIIDKIKKYESFFKDEDDAEMKAKFKKKIEELQAQLEKDNNNVVVAEEKKISEVEAKLKKYRDFYESENDDAEMKARYKKKMDELQAQVDAEKGQIKEEKKVSQELVTAISKVKKAPTKQKIKAALKVVSKKSKAAVKVKAKKSVRKKKLDTILSSLSSLVNKHKALREKYKGKGVDLERDAARPAKPFGYRYTGKHDYRVPKKSEIRAGMASGKIDFEGRPNRSDKFPKGQKVGVKLADGGQVKKNGCISPIKKSIIKRKK